MFSTFHLYQILCYALVFRTQTVSAGLGKEGPFRLVVTFQTAIDNTIEGVKLDRVVVVKQYGRRLVLDLGAPFDLETESNNFKKLFKSVQSVELDYFVSLEQTDLSQITLDDALIVTEMNSTDLSVDGAYISPATQTPLWNLMDSEPFSIHAEGIWQTTNSTPGVVVAVIDTGIAEPAKGLFINLLDGYDFISDTGISIDGDGRDPDSADPGDWGEGCPTPSWHGTKVASILAARHDNEFGMKGVAQNCSILPIRVLGLCRMGYATDVTDAIVWAAGGAINGVPTNLKPAKIISLSLAGQGVCPGYLQSAINQAVALGAIVIAAAGNNNQNVSGYFPANCDRVLSVAASTRDGKFAAYSNWGVIIAMSAPGGDVSNAIMALGLNFLESGLEVAFGMGTSFAVPHVAGVAAIYYSMQPFNTPFPSDLPMSSRQLKLLLSYHFNQFNADSNQCLSTQITQSCGRGIISLKLTNNSLIYLENSTDLSLPTTSLPSFIWENISNPINNSLQTTSLPSNDWDNISNSTPSIVGDAVVSCSTGQYTTDGITCSTCLTGSYRTSQTTPIWAPVLFTPNTVWYSSWMGGSCANGYDCTTPGLCTYNGVFLNQPQYSCPYWCTLACYNPQWLQYWIFWTVYQGWVYNPEVFDITLSVNSGKNPYYYKPDITKSSYINDVNGGILPVQSLTPYTSQVKYCYTCTVCSSGTIVTTPCSTSNDVVCTACSAGTYSTGSGLYICQNCSAGLYSNAASSSCTACAVGKYSSTTSTITCSSCSSGQYSSLKGVTVCNNCMAGTFSNVSGASVCMSCVVGMYSMDMASICTPCAAGGYSATNKSSVCSTCPVGAYSAVVGASYASVCTSCTPGTFTNTESSSQCNICKTVSSCKYDQYVTYCNYGSVSDSLCLDCSNKPLNSFYTGSSPLYDNSKCTWSCNNGYYKNNLDCTLCTVNIDISLCTACPAGTFANITDSYKCTSCSRGSFSTFIGAVNVSACSKCSAGKYASTTESTFCTSCSSGSYSTVIGAYNVSICISCSIGTYTSTEGYTACILCSPGTYSTKTGQTSCNNVFMWNASNYPSITPSPQTAGSLGQGGRSYTNSWFLPGNGVGIAWSSPWTCTTSCTPSSANGLWYLCSGINNPATKETFLQSVWGGTSITYITFTAGVSNAFYFPQITAAIGFVTFEVMCASISCGASMNFGVDLNNNNNIDAGTLAEKGCGMSFGARASGSIVASDGTSTAYISNTLGVGTSWYRYRLLLDIQAETMRVDYKSLYTTVTVNNPPWITQIAYIDAKFNWGTTNAQNPSLWNGVMLTSCKESVHVPWFIFSTYPVVGTYFDSVSLTLQQCTSGTYWVSSSYCQICPSGTFSSDAGMSVCSDCDAGSYASGNGSTVCTFCPPGAFSPVDRSTACKFCVSGAYTPKAGMASCALCAGGTYANATGMSRCALCTEGTYSTSTGASNVSVCQYCTAGTLSSVIGSSNASDCQKCPKGTYSTSTGASDSSVCLNCTAGNYSLSGATKCVQCVAGFTSTEASSVCTSLPPCSLGFYGLTPNCNTCPPNTNSSTGHTLTILDCRCLAGFVCTYTKRINVRLTLLNITWDMLNISGTANSRVIDAIAAAAGVSRGSVVITGIVHGTPGRRRRMMMEPEAASHLAPLPIINPIIPMANSNEVKTLRIWPGRHRHRMPVKEAPPHSEPPPMAALASNNEFKTVRIWATIHGASHLNDALVTTLLDPYIVDSFSWTHSHTVRVSKE